ncbi:DUF3017 domain-containing protein [Streptomyces uncialis]|uniref:DUF3017 domain-containing protein n=1 Tax=Streptomyces uncialis TaxID=1048205 RepID=UPI0037FA9AAB
MPADTPAPAPDAGSGPVPDENPADPAAPTPEVPDAGTDTDGKATADSGTSTGTGTGTGTGTRADDDSGVAGGAGPSGESRTTEGAGVTEPSGESGNTGGTGGTGNSGNSGTSGVTEGPPVAKIRNRRFSLTRDTARPEGGGRAAPGDAPAPARQWPMLTVLGMVGVGLLLTGLDVFRAGTVLIGLGLLTGGLLRWALPSVGMLAVRSRFTDMITYGVLGGMIVLLALMTQPDPVLVVPFLEDTLHFTIQ